MSEPSMPVAAVLGLGTTQIIGYGTLYYAFSILVPDIARDIGRSESWVFGAFSVALLIGGLAAPVAGRLADRHGAGRVLSVGSLAAALSLVLAAVVPGAFAFAAALVTIEVVSTTVLYATAFTAIVQAGGATARRSITHLTLIAGFASSLFWPLTAWLHGFLGWREVYLVFALLNLVICLPIHLALMKLTRRVAQPEAKTHAGGVAETGLSPGPLVFTLMLAGFAIEGYALSAMLVHMVPLTQALGLGGAGLVIAALFGPAQVASRLINLVFGRDLRQVWLAVIAAALMPIGIAVLLAATGAPSGPWLPGAVLFAICMGLGSGLTSIVGGTLPLELFGAKGYGRLMGWSTAAKQVAAALAPLGMSLSLERLGTTPSLVIIAATGLVGTLAFAAIPLVAERRVAPVAG
ncbi:arsenite efflux MFS transporter ArsK [Rhizobium sp. SG2393]|uniref:arsenite efflux MFS transporter ArsK n=1 Tax=Rhizobium sp. SG2393 TaxID=3276279 RepID=UPI00366B829B